MSEKKEIKWRKLEYLDSNIKTSDFSGETLLHIEPNVLSELAKEAFHDISHFLRSEHLSQLKSILEDDEASANDRFVALDF